MKTDNPACYECPKGKANVHYWKRNKDLTATCQQCGLIINQYWAAEAFEDNNDGS